MGILREGKEKYKETKRIIYEAMKNEQLVLFVGAGVSVDSGMPLWRDAISKIAEKMQLTSNQRDYLKIPQYYYNSRGKKEYTQLMREVFKYEDYLLPTKVHKALIDLNTSTIITTNYDHLIEKAAEERGEFLCVVSRDVDMPYRKPKKELIKMHGDFEHDNFVLKEDDYLNYSREFKLIETYVKSILGSKVVLFVGYSLSDPDVLHIISWVKDVLKNDFQRAYLILTKSDPNDIEKDYFRNLGINIIYANELIEEQDLGHSEQLIEVINYLKGEEKINRLDELYNELSPLEALNFVYGKYIADAFGKLGIICREDNSLDMTNDEIDTTNNPLRNAIWRVVNADEQLNDLKEKDDGNNLFDIKKIKSIIHVCEKSKYSNISKIEKSKYYKKCLKSIEMTNVEQKIFEFDGKGLREILNDNNVRLSSDKPDLYMEQAYISAFLFDYTNSYNYLKIAAKLYYSKRQYAKYFIAEFDRKYIGKALLFPWVKYNLSAEDQEKYKDEIAAIDLEKILKSIPNIGNGNNNFLYELKNFTISYTLFYDVYEDSLKANEQASKNYIFFSGTAAYKQLRENIRDFVRYETCNYIFLDNYKENKSIFGLYIRTIMLSINASDITNNYSKKINGNIKPKELIDFDIYIALRFINQKELENYFKEYGIKKLPLSDSAISYLERISKSICDESVIQCNAIYGLDRFWVFLEILNHTSVTNTIVHNVFERLLIIKDEIDINSHKNAINEFFLKIIKEEIYDKKICKQVNDMANLLMNFTIKDINYTVSLIQLIIVLLYFLKKNNSSYNNTKMINKLVKMDNRKVLFGCFPSLNNKCQIIVKKAYIEWRPKSNSVDDYYQYCEGVRNGAIENDAIIEKEIITWISSEIDKTTSEVNLNTQEKSVLRELIDLHLSNNIINTNDLKKVVNKSNDEMLKWLSDLSDFDYTNFKCSWLTLCHKELLQSIANNEKAKKNIVLAYKKKYGSLMEEDKINSIIIKYFI